MNNGFQASLVPTCGVETVKNAETISVSVNWGYVRHIFIFAFSTENGIANIIAEGHFIAIH